MDELCIDATDFCSDKEYALCVTLMAERFNIKIRETPPDPGLNMVVAHDWEGTRIGDLPRQLQAMIRDYWRDSRFPAAYRFAGIVAGNFCKVQPWLNMLPDWKYNGHAHKTGLTWAMLPDHPEGHPVSGIGWMDFVTSMWIGDMFAWIGQKNGRTVMHWGERVIKLPRSGGAKMQFVDDCGTLVSLETGQLIIGLPDKPQCIQLPIGTQQIVAWQNIGRHNYRRGNGLIYKCLRHVIVEIAVGPPADLGAPEAFDSRGNLLFIREKLKMFSPAWVPFVAGAAAPTDPGSLLEYPMEDCGHWTIAPDATLYSSHAHFTRVYVPCP